MRGILHHENTDLELNKESERSSCHFEYFLTFKKNPKVFEENMTLIFGNTGNRKGMIMKHRKLAFSINVIQSVERLIYLNSCCHLHLFQLKAK